MLARTSLFMALAATSFAASSAGAAAMGEAQVVDVQAATASDPLYRYQWHLLNLGQEVIGDTRPTAGIDLKIDQLHKQNVLGQRVKVAVVDDGLEIRHADLLSNIVVSGSKNFADGSNDPTPANPDDGHGTAVAGIVAAVGWNGLGGRGVAPEARLQGFNFLAYEADGNAQDANIRYAWGDGIEAKDAEVFNNSWGTSAQSYPALDPMDTQSWERLMASTRAGKGGVYVKSSGNNFLRIGFLGFDFCKDSTRAMGIGCSLANVDSTNNFIGTIVVASVNARGKRASYSSPGSAVWVSGLGGEYGSQKAYFADTSQIVDSARPTFYDPAIVTTDLTGCAAGDNADRDDGSIFNALDTSTSPLDKSCDYRATMNGTSAAAPTVSGVAALMLGVNPSLSARDVKYILATTARQIDPWQPKATYNGAVQDPGWIINAAGHPFSNWYGFGLVDAAAAVAAARDFRPLPPMQDSGWQSSKSRPVAIGGIYDTDEGKLTVRIDQRMRVEAVQLAFKTDHKKPRQLRAVLTSPSGTQSYALPAFTTLSDTDGGFAVDLTSSNAFLDEQAAGEWSLQVLDMVDDSQASQLQSFNLRVVGH